MASRGRRWPYITRARGWLYQAADDAWYPPRKYMVTLSEYEPGESAVWETGPAAWSSQPETEGPARCIYAGYLLSPHPPSDGLSAGTITADVTRPGWWLGSVVYAVTDPLLVVYELRWDFEWQIDPVNSWSYQAGSGPITTYVLGVPIVGPGPHWMGVTMQAVGWG